MSGLAKSRETSTEKLLRKLIRPLNLSPSPHEVQSTYLLLKLQPANRQLFLTPCTIVIFHRQWFTEVSFVQQVFGA